MLSETDPDDLTLDEAAEAMNAYNAMGRERRGNEEKLGELAERLTQAAADRVHHLVHETPLSQREAEVVALKEWGLTHHSIHRVYQMMGSTVFDARLAHSDAPQAAAIDTYSRRARDKYLDAVSTTDELANLYDD